MFRAYSTGKREGEKEFDIVYVKDISVAYQIQNGYIYSIIQYVTNAKHYKKDSVCMYKFKGINQFEKLKKIIQESMLENISNMIVENHQFA